MRAIILGVLLLSISCDTSKNGAHGGEETSAAQTEEERYLQSTPDAPLDFYCQVNGALNSNTRVAICNLASSKSPTLSADMLIEIKGHEIDTVEIVIFSFDTSGNRKIEDIGGDLNTVVNSISASDLVTFRNLNDGPYIARLQLERFCIGYVTNISLEDETAKRIIGQSTASE